MELLGYLLCAVANSPIKERIEPASFKELDRILLRQTLDVDGENPARNRKLAEVESASVMTARKPALARLL